MNWRRWITITALSLGGVLLLALLAVYGASELKLRKTWALPLIDLAIPGDTGSITEGKRLAAIRGCTGCHEADLGGHVFFDEPWVARIVAVNVTRFAAEHSTAELVRAIRHGVDPDGHGLAGMPSSMFYGLTDADLSRIVAYVRSVPPVDRPLPGRSIRILGRLGLLLGEYQLESDVVDHQAPPLPAGSENRGQYLAMTSCTECHGAKLLGGDGPNGPPALTIVNAYSEPAFREFLRTGKALGGRELSLMSEMARERFTHFTDGEITDVYAYLKTLGS